MELLTFQNVFTVLMFLVAVAGLFMKAEDKDKIRSLLSHLPKAMKGLLILGVHLLFIGVIIWFMYADNVEVNRPNIFVFVVSLVMIVRTAIMHSLREHSQAIEKLESQIQVLKHEISRHDWISASKLAGPQQGKQE